MTTTIKKKQHTTHRPGYKHTPLGWIPEEWDVKEIGELFTFKNGLNKEKEFFGQGTPIINYVDVYKNTALSEKDIKGKVTLSTSEINNYEARKGDVFFTRTSETIDEIGLSAVVIDDLKNTVFSGFVLRARPKNERLELMFKKYCFSSDKARKEIITKSTCTTRALTNGTLLSKVLIPLPPLPEQRKIAAILITWDNAIQQTQKLIIQLRKRNKGLAQQLLTGKKRLKGFKGEWKKEHADTIFKSVSVKNNGNEVLLSATQERGIIPRDMLDGRVTMPTGDTNSFKLVEEGDFVISLRSFQGGIEYSEYRGIVSPAYTVLKPSKPVCDSFYKHYFKSYDFIGHLAVAVIGIRDGKQISYDDFGFLKLPNPLLEEQQAIAAVLDKANQELKQQQQYLTTLQAQKKGLMQQLLTGAVRVKIENKKM